jgi:hypothetical protein
MTHHPVPSQGRLIRFVAVLLFDVIRARGRPGYMKFRILILLFAVLAFGFSSPSRAQDVARLPNEADAAFAQRVLQLNADSDPHSISAPWNGVPTLFVDYQITKGDETNRPLVALAVVQIGITVEYSPLF